MIVASKGNISKAIGYMQCGKCYAELGNLSEAIVYLDNVIRLDSELVSAFCERGKVRHEQGNLESALADFNRAIELAPSFADAHYERGLCLAKKNEFEGALESFNTALKIFPDDYTFLGDAGKTYLLLGRPNEAMVCFCKQAVIEPLSAEPLVKIAQCYCVMDDFIEALNSAQLALGRDENCADAYEQRGIVMHTLKCFSHAIFDFWNALRISKDIDIVEKLYNAVSKSDIFRPFANDCLLAQNGEISIDELVVRLGKAIRENL